MTERVYEMHHKKFARDDGTPLLFILLTIPPFCKVQPCGIERIDQCYLFAPLSCFELFLPCYRLRDKFVLFEIDQRKQLIFLGKSALATCFVFIDSSVQVRRHSCIQNTISPVRHDIHIAIRTHPRSKEIKTHPSPLPTQSKDHDREDFAQL